MSKDSKLIPSVPSLEAKWMLNHHKNLKEDFNAFSFFKTNLIKIISGLNERYNQKKIISHTSVINSFVNDLAKKLSQAKNYTAIFVHLHIAKNKPEAKLFNELFIVCLQLCELPELKQGVENERNARDRFNNPIEASCFETELAHIVLQHAPTESLKKVNDAIVLYCKKYKALLLQQDKHIVIMNELIKYKVCLAADFANTCPIEKFIDLLNRPLTIPQNISECASLHLIFFNWQHIFALELVFPQKIDEVVAARDRIHRTVRPNTEGKIFHPLFRGRIEVISLEKTQEFGITEPKYLDQWASKWHRLPITPHKYRARANPRSPLVKNFIKHRIPYISGPSGTAADVLEGLIFLCPSLLLNAQEETLLYFNLLAASEVAQGHHSWYEVMLPLYSLCGYEVDMSRLYENFLSHKFKENPVYADLTMSYPQFLNADRHDQTIEKALCALTTSFDLQPNRFIKKNYTNGVLFLGWEGTIVALNNSKILLNEKLLKRVMLLASQYNIAIHIVATNKNAKNEILKQLHLLHPNQNWELCLHFVAKKTEKASSSDESVTNLIAQFTKETYPHLPKNSFLFIDAQLENIEAVAGLIPVVPADQKGNHFELSLQFVRQISYPVFVARWRKTDLAYRRLMRGQFWKHSEHIQGKKLCFATFKQLSKENRAALEAELKPLSKEEKLFIKALCQQNLDFTHYTSAIEEIMQSGVILSQAALQQEDISFNNHSSIDDLGLGNKSSRTLANGDFVFFRAELTHLQDKTSRFGQHQFICEGRKFKNAWVSLFEMYNPVTGTKIVKDEKGNALRSYSKDSNGVMTFTYGNQTHTIDLVKTIFLGDDILPGIALCLVRELRRIGAMHPEYQKAKLADLTPTALNLTLATFFRIEGKVPSRVILATTPHRWKVESKMPTVTLQTTDPTKANATASQNLQKGFSAAMFKAANGPNGSKKDSKQTVAAETPSVDIPFNSKN